MTVPKARVAALALGLAAFAVTLFIVLRPSGVQLKWRPKVGEILRYRHIWWSRPESQEPASIEVVYAFRVSRVARDGIITFEPIVLSRKGTGTASNLLTQDDLPRALEPYEMQPNGERLAAFQGDRRTDFVLPSGRVSPGDTWIVTLGSGTGELEARYLLEKIGNGNAHISMTGVYKNPPQASNPEYYKLIHRSVRGSAIFSLDKGIMLEWSEERRSVHRVMGEDKSLLSTDTWTLEQ